MENIYYCSKFRERERPVGRGKGWSTRMLGRGQGMVSFVHSNYEKEKEKEKLPQILE